MMNVRRILVALLVVLMAVTCETNAAVAQNFPQVPPPPVTESIAESAAALGEKLREKAAQGDRHAQLALGTFTEIAGQDANAAVWYRQAADQGDASAQGRLGNMYRSGRGVPQDFREAYHWSRAAADLGDPLGELTLSSLNALGEGRPV